MHKKSLDRFYDLVEAFEQLPTIGKKSAQRLAFYIINDNTYAGLKIAHTIEDSIKHIKHCVRCGFISENELCDICLDESREQEDLAIVQAPQDIFTIEQSNHFNGKYFILKNIQSDTMQSLEILIQEQKIKNILFALTPSVANDALILFVEEYLKRYKINFTKIAQGIPTGVSLENIDILSLSKAIDGKIQI